MTRGMCAHVTALCLLACVVEGARAAWANDAKNVIAVLPCTDVVMTLKKFSPLVAYLENETGTELTVVVPRSQSEFRRALRQAEIDFALQDPHTYMSLAELFDRDSLLFALNRDGTHMQRGVVIARKDSGIGDLRDLRGRRVMFGDELSAVKWMAAKALFTKNGLDIDRDLASYSHGGCCEDIAFSVFLKAVDAGVVCDHFLAGHAEEQRELGVDADALFVVARSEPVPSRVFASRKGIERELSDAVVRALLNLDARRPAHSKILGRAEFGGFKKTTDADYAGMRATTPAK